MKGVILAGGLGTRLYPLTHVTNKHLLPIYDQPMIYYPIQTLVKAGITDIMIISSGPHSGQFIQIIKNGTEFGIRHLEYGYQENPIGGLADGLKIAEAFAEGGPIAFILGDNTTDANITPAVKAFKRGSVMFLKKVPDPRMFGVPVFDKKDPKKIIGIVEKPKNPPSQYASAGVYIFDNRCFEVAKKLKPSPRGQLEITDVQNFYIKDGSMKWYELDGFWRDAGTFEALLEASTYWAKKKGIKV